MAGAYPPAQGGQPYPPRPAGQWQYPPPPPPGGQWTGGQWTGHRPPYPPRYPHPPYPPPYYPPAPQRPHPARWAVVGLVLVMFVAFAVTTLAYAVSRSASGSAWHAGTGVAAAPVPSGTPAGSPGDLSSVAAALDPAVVNIQVTLGLRPGRAAAGTGIVLTSSGEVLTNNHVIDGGTSIRATDVGNGRTYEATVVGYDRSRDLAVLQLQGAANLATATIGDSSRVAVNDPVVAVGNAGGRGGTPTAVGGTVTGLEQTITASDENGGNAEQLTGMIRVAANIEPGDSGGPLADMSARVIGVNTAATAAGSRSRTTGNEGFAIPINQAMTVASQIAAGQASATVHLGPTAFLGVQTSATGGSGASVAAVVPDSPAAQAGIAQGDVITAIDGTPIGSATDLTTALTGHHPGDQVTVHWTDGSGRAHSAPVRLATGPAA
jgi:S1-C subfamily serine protease